MSEETINEYNILNREQINEATKKARNAFVREWSTISIDKRTDFLHDFAAELRKNKEYLAKTATLEMGKAIKESRSEVEKCAWAIEYFADNGKAFSNDEIINTEAEKNLHNISTYWGNRKYYALEFSILAGTSICCSFTDGW